MYVNLSKKFITKNLLPHLSQTNLGRRSKIPLWRVLPMKFFCREKLISWNTVVVAYQGRKKAKTTNALFLTDKQGIPVDGLFLNADTGFDSKKVRSICDAKGIIPNIDKNKRNSKLTDNQYIMDELIYKERFAVERTNAWLDTFKALLIRFETTANSWTSLHYHAC